MDMETTESPELTELVVAGTTKFTNLVDYSAVSSADLRVKDGPMAQTNPIQGRALKVSQKPILLHEK
jgi:hypothetical protein